MIRYAVSFLAFATLGAILVVVGARAPDRPPPPSEVDLRRETSIGAPAPSFEVRTPSPAAPVVERSPRPLDDEASLMDQLRNAEKREAALAEKLARDGNRRFPNSPGAPERAAALVRAIAQQGRLSEARGEAEAMVNQYADSPWAREVEQQTGAHPRRNQ